MRIVQVDLAAPIPHRMTNMKIVWNQNPLSTSIVLDEHDKEILRLKLKISYMEEIYYEIVLYGSADSKFDIERVRANLSWDKFDEEDNEKFRNFLDERTQQLVNELEFGIHCGDCTCVPASCFRCYAENLIGVNTIEGCGKHSLYKIQGAFYRADKSPVTIDQAIKKLENYEVGPRPASWPEKMDYDVHIPRWTAEAKHAANWLKQYKEEHWDDFIFPKRDSSKSSEVDRFPETS